MEKEKSFQQILLEQLNIRMQKKNKKNIDIDLTPCTKISLKWILDLNTKMQNCKISRRKHVRQYTWFWVWWWGFWYNTESMIHERKKMNLGFIKIHFLPWKKTVKEWKDKSFSWKIYLQITYPIEDL